MAPWSSGQDASLSRWNQGFDSPGSHIEKEILLDFLFGSMSIVGVGFYKSRSIIAFEAIFMFFVQMHIFLHGKQTFKCQS